MQMHTLSHAMICHEFWVSEFICITWVQWCMCVSISIPPKKNSWRTVHLSRVKYSILSFTRKNVFRFGFAFRCHGLDRFSLSAIKMKRKYIEKSDRMLRSIAWLMEKHFIHNEEQERWDKKKVIYEYLSYNERTIEVTTWSMAW